MPKSMTGFGRAVRESAAARTVVTRRSVNHRGLKLVTRLPDALFPVQGRLEAMCRERLDRGTVHLDIDYRALEGQGGYRLNAARLGRYLDGLADAMAARGGEPQALRVELVAQLPGVVEEAGVEAADEDALLAEVTPALEEALDALAASREREGDALAAHIRERLAAIAERLASVQDLVPKAVDAYMTRSRQRVERLLEGARAEVDGQALMRELALFAEKTDVSEEIARLKAHLVETELALTSPKPVGRRLEFLAQELLREANTMASKSADTELLQHVLEIKVDVDRIREQVANVE